MKKLSTGQDSTLENWIGLSAVFFGEDSPATKFLIEKANTAPDGIHTEVISDERQLIYALVNMAAHEGDTDVRRTTGL